MVFPLALRGRVNIAKYFGCIVPQYLYYFIIPKIIIPKINLEVYFKYDSVHRCLTKEVKCNLNLSFKAYKSRKTQKEAK